MSSLKPNMPYKTRRNGNNRTKALGCEVHCKWHNVNEKFCHLISDQILFSIHKQFWKGYSLEIGPFFFFKDQAATVILWKLYVLQLFAFFISYSNLTWAVPNAMRGEELYALGVFGSLKQPYPINSPISSSPVTFLVPSQFMASSE